jgi:hypothetical protein
MKEIDQNSEDLRSEKVLPLNCLFTKASMLDRKMIRGNIQKDEEINYEVLRLEI